MNLNLNTLAYVVEVSKTGSISRASENLLLSQPYLSNTIKALEKELGFSLFRRLARGVELTDEGKSFVRHAQDVLARAQQLESTYFLDATDRMRIRITLTRSHRIMRHIAEFINQHNDKKELLVRVNETNPFAVMEDVHERAADFGVLNCFDAQEEFFLSSFKTYGLQYIKHYHRKFLLCLSQNSPLAKVPLITREMLKDQIAVLYGDYEASAASYDVVTEVSDIVFSQKRIYVYDRGGAMDTLSRCDGTYMWITGLHRDTLHRYGLVLRECEGVDVGNVGYFVFHSLDELPKYTRALMDTLLNIDWTEEVV